MWRADSGEWEGVGGGDEAAARWNLILYCSSPKLSPGDNNNSARETAWANRVLAVEKQPIAAGCGAQIRKSL